MRLRRFVSCFGINVIGAMAIVLAAPAHAEHSHGAAPGAPPAGPDMRPEWKGDRGSPPMAMQPRTRGEWLAECRDRIGRGPGANGPDDCEVYLDRYLDLYRQGGFQPAGPAGYGCCYAGPIVMVPVMLEPRVNPDCTETVEYVDAPRAAARRAPRRMPDKRIRLVPDKRIRAN